MNSKKVPLLSLKKYTHGSDKEKAKFEQDLFNGFKEYGFVVIENHTIDKNLLKKSYSLSKEFFDLPFENKNHYKLDKNFSQRGYTPYLTEHARDSKGVKDLKEFYHVGRELSEEKSKLSNHIPNVWPSEVVEFKETFLKMYSELEKVGDLILKALTPSLGVAPDFFSMTNEGSSVLRLLNYPPIPDGADPKALRAAAHFDINLITLLVAPDVPKGLDSGLSLLDKDGEWLPIKSNPDTIIVNIGDMIERITNGYLKSTLHRVTNPDPDRNISRRSAPFFIHPRGEVVLKCLAKFVGDGENFPPITAEEFLHERLKEIGLKK
jgi:isopenicillin N synthase-like dioxygenase